MNQRPFCFFMWWCMLIAGIVTGDQSWFAASMIAIILSGIEVR